MRGARGLGLRGGWLLWTMAVGAVLVLAAGSARSASAAGPAVARKAAGSFEIPAYAFDRGNAQTFTEPPWADAAPMVAFGGQSPIVVEYDIPFPATAEYTLLFRYAAAEARPVEVLLDGKPIGQGCRQSFGCWNTSSARWEESCRAQISRGIHTMRLERAGAFPHLVQLRFETSVTLPENWELHRLTARKLDSPPFSGGGAVESVAEPKPGAMRLAMEDLIATFGERYAGGKAWLARLEGLEQELKRAREAAKGSDGSEAELKRVLHELDRLRREALLANPLLDFDRLLVVRRGAASPQLGLPQNWQSNSCLAKTGYDDEIAVLSPVRPEGQLTTLFRPDGGRFVGDVDLDFDSSRLLFSMPGANGRWQIFQLKADGTDLRQLTGSQPDVDSYDACYLPSGKILFTSTACFVGVPCVYGGSHVANLYVMDGDGRNIRQLCFDQEHDWCPTVLGNGRVLYSRWEYADTPHSNTRLLFHMNPDGTGQTEYYGSNSYWPNAVFYARPVPNHPTKVVGIVGGHHDNPRMGELVIFDPAQGRREATGVVQRIPGHGKRVEPLVRDGLTLASWPKFLHPYPLSDKYFLVAARPTPASLWGIYLVDIFDNMVLVKELPGYAMFEPLPLRKTTRPPVIPEKVDLARRDAIVYLPDVYAGGGLKGIPRGKVKSLRLVTYHFAYQGMGGLLGVVGMDGPWDIKRVLGTVPVNEDGSAKFRIPANVPISLQPLDEEGKALQLMRSWMTAMPGEVVQCNGCHEPQNTAAMRKATLATSQAPAEIRPWRGPLRGFSYAREVQPVVDRYCVGCHDGKARADGRPICDLRGDRKITDWKSVTPGNGGPHAGKFSVGYAELHRYVRRPGIESDYHMLEPMEYHADTTELVQMLKQGHHGVRLDAEAWDRLVTWIDLNCPYHGTWGEEIDNPGVQRQRRRELLELYGNVDDDPEAVPAGPPKPVEAILPKEPAVIRAAVDCPGWPFDAAEAKRRQKAAGPAVRRTIELGEEAKLELALIPAGPFVMGSATDGTAPVRARIGRPFWMGICEITNGQYAQFDPGHDSRVESKNAYQFGIHGYPMNRPWQPVVRVSWQEAAAFCAWLSRKTGERFSLPTEAQWEYACRAGTSSAFWFGGLDDDFSPFANLADASLSKFASDPYTVDTPLANPTKYDDWIPKDVRFNDGATITARPASYRANAWGLCDMHGNVAEWTASEYRAELGESLRADASSDTSGPKVVRGGSWRDRPYRATSSFRTGYPAYQRVYNVGFRVICETDAVRVAAREGRR